MKAICHKSTTDLATGPVLPQLQKWTGKATNLKPFVISLCSADIYHRCESYHPPRLHIAI